MKSSWSLTLFIDVSQKSSFQTSQRPLERTAGWICIIFGQHLAVGHILTQHECQCPPAKRIGLRANFSFGHFQNFDLISILNILDQICCMDWLDMNQKCPYACHEPFGAMLKRSYQRELCVGAFWLKLCIFLPIWSSGEAKMAISIAGTSKGLGHKMGRLVENISGSNQANLCSKFGLGCSKWD